MATEVKIVRSAALALFAFCGWKSSGNWSNDKLAEKMKDVPDVAPEGKVPEDEAVAKTLIDVKAGLESNATFVVTDDVPGTFDPNVAPTATESTEGTVPTTEAVVNGAPVAEKPKKEKKPKEPKAPKAPKEPKPPKEPSKGVRDSAGRGYFAGRVMFDSKMSGVNKDLVEDLNTRVGQKNDAMSKLALVWAYNAIRGYLDAQAGVPAPAPTVKIEKPELTGSVPPAPADATNEPVAASA